MGAVERLIAEAIRAASSNILLISGIRTKKPLERSGENDVVYSGRCFNMLLRKDMLKRADDGNTKTV